jgi:apolipoprotein N-acyltransferase
LRGAVIAKHLLSAGLSLFSAALLVLAFPDFNLWFLVWVGFVPLFYALGEKPSVRRAFLLGELFGIGLFYGSCYWITYSMIHYGGLPPAVAYSLAIVPVAISALFPAFFAAALARLLQSLGPWAFLAAPILWVAFEYLRLHITGMGWNSLGYSLGFLGFQHELIWPARFGGVYLVSAIIMLPSAAIALAMRVRDRRTAGAVALSIVFCLGIYLIGRAGKTTPTGEGIDVVAIQGNVPVGEVPLEVLREGFRRHFDMTRENLPPVESRTRPVVAVWPEAPFNFEYDRDRDLQRAFGDFTSFHKIYLLFNANTGLNETISYNSVVIVGPEGKHVGQYDKIHLLPFGEYVPFRDVLPLINRIPALAGEFKAGSKYSVIEIEGYKLGTSICFESVFPDITREMARSGASAFINIADDAWFGPTPIARQHLAHVVMRAVETGLPLLRVTNTGISASIAPDGRVSGETPIFETAARTWHLAINRERPPLTFYTRFGDLFAIACFSATVLLIMYTSDLLKRRRKRLYVGRD